MRVFRMDENAKRIQRSAEGIMMPALPVEKFMEMVKMVVRLNARFIPPYGSGASLYIRPLEIGMSAQVGVKPATEYLFVIFVSPVGPYFKGGFSTNPKKYMDECGAANFFGIKDNTYITPLSTSILPSITNKSLMQLAEDMGIKVERRQIPEDELTTLEEAGACGTAAVISPIERIDDPENNRSYVISKDGKPGPLSTKLYNRLRGIQLGEEEDVHNWNTIIEL